MMPEKTLNFLTADGKTRLTLSGAYEQMLESIHDGSMYVTKFSGLIVFETENAVEVVDSGDKLLPDPVNDGDFNVVKLHQHHKEEILPVTPITKMVPFTPSKDTGAEKKTPSSENSKDGEGHGYDTPRRKNEEAEDETEEEMDGVEDDDDSVALDYEYSQQVNWVDDETMAFLQEHSSPTIEAHFNACSPDKTWIGTKKNKKNNP
jgi:hypothetical protein